MLIDGETGYFHVIRKEFHDLFLQSPSFFTRPEFCGSNKIFPFIYNRVQKGLPVCIDWRLISNNTNHYALELLKENIDKVHWYILSANPCREAVEILKQYPEKIDWEFLSCNWCTEAVELLLENPDKICLSQLCRNKSARAMYFLENQIAAGTVALNDINWQSLSSNLSNEAMRLVSQNIDKLDSWYSISQNPFAIELLIQHVDKIDWQGLSSNPHPRALQLLMNHSEKIHYDGLSCNTNTLAIQWLEKKENIDKINWYHLSSNPSAIDLLVKHKDKIDYSALVFNEGLCDII